MKGSWVILFLQLGKPPPNCEWLLLGSSWPEDTNCQDPNAKNWALLVKKPFPIMNCAEKMTSFKYSSCKGIMPMYTLCICWYCQYNGGEITTLNQTSPIKLITQVVLPVSVSSAFLQQCFVSVNLKCRIVALKICIFSGCWEKEKVNLNTWISTIEAKTERWLNLVLNFIEVNLMVSAVALCGDCFQYCFIKLRNGRSSNSVIVEMVNLRSIWDCLPICKCKGFQGKYYFHLPISVTYYSKSNSFQGLYLIHCLKNV